MILSVKVRFYTYEENKKNHVKFEFNFDGLEVWKRHPSGFDFLRSLCNNLNSLHTLFMKDCAVRGRSSWISQLFQSVVSSSIRDMLMRTHKKLIVYNFLVN
jgi:hypothetical protein